MKWPSLTEKMEKLSVYEEKKFGEIDSRSLSYKYNLVSKDKMSLKFLDYALLQFRS